MRCMFCDSMDSRVVDSRPTEDGWAIRRRRECISCGKRFTTYEKIEDPVILVVKKDGRREAFERDKIRNSIIKACEKRTVGMKEIEELVGEVEKKVFNLLEPEVNSQVIGELVMDGLKTLDQVAYVRFASVYRQFKDISTFKNELNKLLEDH